MGEDFSDAEISDMWGLEMEKWLERNATEYAGLGAGSYSKSMQGNKSPALKPCMDNPDFGSGSNMGCLHIASLYRLGGQ